jgi:D-beta-D-heptose 7-phosphate kinase / D-beta-D-heptose 1-phosphate adenosyltransferase
VKQHRAVPGGAGNVALNIAGLHAHASVVGVCGDDAAGEELAGLLRERGIEAAGLVIGSGRPTTCKTRVMCGNHQIVRLDEESTTPVKASTAGLLLRAVHSALDQDCQGIILSDYAKGIFSADFTREVIRAGSARGVPVLVDPKRSDYVPYAGATCVTPNLKEFKAASMLLGLGDEDLSAAGLAMLERIQCQALLVTQGSGGMTLFSGGSCDHFPALAEEVFDVSGAGDTVISAFATALASGIDLLTSVQLANIAASLVVRRTGTAPIDWAALAGVVFHDGFISLPTAPANPDARLHAHESR